MPGDMGMFGAPVGMMNASSFANSQAALQYRMGQIAMQPAQLRQEVANAQLLEQKVQDERRFSELMMRAGSSGAPAPTDANGQPRGPAANLWTLSDLAMRAGLVDKAASLAKTASTIEAQQAGIRAHAAATRLSGLKAEQTQMNLIGTLMTSVTDQNSWDRANALFQFQTGLPSPYAGLPYNADMVKKIRDGAMTVKQQIDLRMKEEEDASKERARQGLADHRKRIEALVADRNRIMEEREKRISKSGGGKGVSSPSRGETLQAMREIKRDYPQLAKDVEGLNTAAYDIASEARALRKANPALDANTAIAQAYLAARQRGDFKTTIEQNWLSGTTKQTFVGGGRTPETALAIPAKSSELVNNRYYVGAQGSKYEGRILQWTGKGFKLADNPRALSGDNANVDDSDLGSDTEDSGDSD